MFLGVRWLAVQRSNGVDSVDVLVGCLLFLARGRVESSQYVHRHGNEERRRAILNVEDLGGGVSYGEEVHGGSWKTGPLLAATVPL